MALRVLLADNSDTIKKVIQLALQDFAVEVKTVTVGTDVLEVARAFRPDIIFADVLLQQRNGYEVSTELKSQADLSFVPVVLMWSGFMELDEQKFKNSGANERLEKPFDGEILRSLIQNLVPKTKQQDLGQHLVFPSIPKPPKEEGPPAPAVAQTPSAQPVAAPPAAAQTPATVVEPQRARSQKIVPPFAPLPGSKFEEEEPKPVAPVPAPAAPPQEPQERNWSMDSFEDIQKFEKDAGISSFGGDLPDDSNTSIPLVASPKGERPGDLPDLELAGVPNENGPEEADQFSMHSFSGGPNIDLGDELEPIELEEPDPSAAPPSKAALAKAALAKTLKEEEAEDQNWVRKDIGEFEVNLPSASDELSFDFVTPEEEIKPSDFLYNPRKKGTMGLDEGTNIRSAPVIEERPVQRSRPEPEPEAARIPSLTEEQIEAILRSQSLEIIEKIAMKLVPDIASEIIKREIRRLLDESPKA